MAPRLKERYREEVVPALMKEFAYQNVMQVPRLQKIVVNIGLGEALQNPKALDSASEDVAAITGQKPVITRAKRSIANFKLRTGMPIGVTVTLRGDRMYELLDRMVNAALPRIRDFQGVSPDSFDGRGNYSLGIKEQVIFPELEYDKIDRIRGLQFTMVTSARSDEEGKRLLELMGMPFARREVRRDG
jgi:large subunit ribosomal protein L5